MRNVTQRLFRSSAMLLLALALCGTLYGAEGRILLTGFEPFGKEPVNSSWEAVKSFDGKSLDGYAIVVAQLPVVWGEPMKRLAALIDEHKPDAVFSFGQGHPQIFTCERLARNKRIDYPDNEKKKPGAKQIVAGGPARYVNPFSVDEAFIGLTGKGYRVFVSYDAGGYLCEETLYSLLHLRQKARKPFACGFFHVPPYESPLRLVGRVVRCDTNVLNPFVETVVRSWIRAQKADR